MREDGGSSVAEMLDLPNVTLCAVETRNAAAALTAIKKSIDAINFAKILLVSARPAQTDIPNLSNHVTDSISSIIEYSDFVLNNLNDLIDTDFVLLIQWDGYVIHPEQWRDDFLSYDYIGAPWPHFHQDRAVGNGGFSLRSKRLLRAVASDDIAKHHPEDVAICHTNRAILEEKFQIKFAPLDVAKHFSFEREEPVSPTFGFHGMFNFGRIFGHELNSTLKDLPSATLRSREARELCLSLLRSHDKSHRKAGRALLFRMLVHEPKSKANWYVYQQWLIHLKNSAANRIFS